ncbi:carboxypeptidase-like regulatory domain-containing protein [Polaribacter sp.]|uniref:carboxypeptidase-like regulatory domain-containing protein n=1 Tax=Polaribacter sp. TaxID=1920175 RepID=UPI003F6ACA38
MKKIFTLIFLQTIILSYGQKKIYVIDSLTNKEIEYATIKFDKVNDGTYSNENGIFHLPDNIKKIEISCLGYKTRKIVNLPNDTIFLKPKEIQLDEIILKKNKKIVFGKKKSKLDIGFSSYSESVIFAKKIVFKDNFFITKAHFDILNDQKERKFRFLIYDLNKNLMPNNNILNQNIISKIQPYDKKVELDLEKFNIYLEKGEYFIAIEIFDMSKTNGNSSIKLGCYKTSEKNESLSKPVFNESENWKSIKTYNQKKEYSYNFYLTLEM